MSDTMEPALEIKRFLDEIASSREISARGLVGGVSESSSPDPEGDHFEALDFPGTPIITEVWARTEKRVWVTSRTARNGFTRYSAEWRYPTVSLWRRLGPSGQSPAIQERRLWQVFLVNCSLSQKPLIFSGGLLSDESFRDILKFSPSVIPTALVHGFLRRTIVSQQELSRIERECQTLWRTEGGSIKNPHPILEQVITAMGLYERFGITTWANLDEVHVKVYSVIRKVMEVYAICQNLNMKDDDLRKKAAKMAGISHLTGR